MTAKISVLSTSKYCQWWSSCDVLRWTVTEPETRSSKQSVSNS